MTSSSSSSSGGIGFAGAMTIVFIVLKLIHKISWSWWWILSPMWIGAAVAVAFLILVAGGAAVAHLISGRSRRPGR